MCQAERVTRGHVGKSKALCKVALRTRPTSESGKLQDQRRLRHRCIVMGAWLNHVRSARCRVYS